MYKKKSCKKFKKKKPKTGRGYNENTRCSEKERMIQCITIHIQYNIFTFLNMLLQRSGEFQD